MSNNSTIYFTDLEVSQATLLEWTVTFLRAPNNILLLLLSVSGLIINCLLTAAVGNITKCLPFRLQLILSFAISNILICVVRLTLLLFAIMNILLTIEEKLCIYSSMYAVQFVAISTLFLNLVAISFDHFISILSPHRYISLLTSSFGKILILVIWISTSISGICVHLTGLIQTVPPEGYCFRIWFGISYLVKVQQSITSICFFITLGIYTRIYCAFRNIGKRMRKHNRKYTKDKRALQTTLFIVGTFVLFYMPFNIFDIVQSVSPHEISGPSQEYLYVLQTCICIIHPIIYSLRNKDIQIGFKNWRKNLCKWNAYV